MLYNRITDRDVEQYFYKTLFLYAGRPVYCNGTSAKELIVFDLETQQTLSVVFDPELCKPLQDRIGMVNCDGNAVYVSRIPVRKFQIGISAGNTRFSNVGGGGDSIRIASLKDKRLLDAINNKYPTFEEALAKDKRSVAFDKQFAVGYGIIYYRTLTVGEVKGKKICFNPQYAYLESLMEKKYAKDRGSLRIPG